MTADTISAPSLPAERTLPGRPSLLRQLLRRPSGVFSVAVISILLFLVVFGPTIAPYTEAQQDIEHRLEGPSADHWLGTDHLGRDLLSRLVIGTRVALGTAFPAVLSALFAGMILGLVAGYVGGWVDNLLLILFDSLMAFPALMLALALMSLLDPSIKNVILVIAISYTPGYARIVRAQVLAAKEEQFVEVEEAFGAGHLRILFVHILPNILAPLFIMLAMDLPTAITTEAGLSFLGLGVRPPTPSWGVILSDGFEKIRTSPWPVLWGALTLMTTTLSFTLFGETLRDILDPRLAGSRRTG
jgi:peptide/nickel transport system permease protein